MYSCGGGGGGVHLIHDSTVVSVYDSQFINHFTNQFSGREGGR